MIRMNVEAKSARDGLERRLRSLLRVSLTVAQASVLAEKMLREGTPVDSGETAAGWETRTTSAPGGAIEALVTHPFNDEGARHPVTGQIVNDGEGSLLVWLEYGTSAHEIEARRAKFLRFEVSDQEGDRVVYRKRVQHRGTRAHAMMRHTADVVHQKFRIDMEQLAKGTP